MSDLHVLAISGSLRQGSHNTALLREAARLAPELSIEIDTAVGWLPLFDEDAEHPAPAPVAELRSRIAAADAVLIATPEYNAGIPGGLKNALDWLSRPAGADAPPLRRKPVAVIGASAGPFGTIRAQGALRQVLHKLDAAVLGQPELLLPAAGQALPDGRLADDSLPAAVLREILTGLADLVRIGRLTAVPAGTGASSGGAG